MTYAMTIPSFFILALASACANPKHPNKDASLPCEPVGLVDLPYGACVGTVAAKAEMTPDGCVCRNREYVAVPTPTGRACVHLHSVLGSLQNVHETIAELNLPAPKQTVHLYPRSTAQTALVNLHRLDKDARRLHELLLTSAPQSDVERAFIRVQRGIRELGTQRRTEICIPSPEPSSRERILGMYEKL
jgi:hypothetical protein